MVRSQLSLDFHHPWEGSTSRRLRAAAFQNFLEVGIVKKRIAECMLAYLNICSVSMLPIGHLENCGQDEISLNWTHNTLYWM